MADYQGRLKVTLQGLDQLKQLDDRLASIESRADNVREAIAGIGNEISTNLVRKNRALRDLVDTREERLSSQGSIRSTAQRRNAQRNTFLQGPNVNARRLARARLLAAEAETKNAQLELGQALQERREIVRSGIIERGRRLQQRTLPSLVLGGDRIAEKREKTLRNVTESASATNQQLRLGSFDAQYQRRLQAFRRGGGGTNAPKLIEEVFKITQAYNALKRVISATGDTSARVTRKQAAELSTLSAALGRYNEAQLESNRSARSRVERLSAARKLGDRLRPMEAASGTAQDPRTGELLYPDVTRPAFSRREVGKARLLVNRAARAAESGDQELFRLASFQAKKIIDRMEAGAKAGLKTARTAQGRIEAATKAAQVAVDKATKTEVSLSDRTFNDKLRESKERARREADLFKASSKEAGKDFNQRLQNRVKQRQVEQRAAVRDLNVKSSWQSALLGLAGIGATQQLNQGGKNLNARASWQKALTQMGEIGVDIQGAQKAKGSNVKASWQKALTQMGEIGADLERASKQRFNKRLRQEEERLASLGIGVNAPARIGGPVKRTGAIPMGGGVDSGIMPRALPSSNMLAERVANSRQIQPTRLDDLQAAAQKRAAEETKRAAGSVGRFAAALEREEKRLAGLGVGAPDRVGGTSGRSRAGAIPMGGQGGRPGMFDQYSFPAGPGNQYGAAEFSAIQKSQRAQQRQQGKQKGFFQGDPRKAIGEGLIGGAFPLLFGQGLGASIGGFAGGATGGMIGGSFGFGLSLIGTALGQVVDTTIGKLGDLGGALDNAGDSIKALEDAGFRVRDSQKVQIAQLEKVGRGYDAQAVALKEIESRLGPGSVAQIEKLNEAQKQLSDSWAALSLQLGVSLIPIVAEAANLIADLFGRSPGGSGSGAAPKSTRPRKPSEVLADIDASIAFNQALKAGNREYASLVRDVEDWRRDNEDKIFQMRRQGVDIEKQKSDLRLDVENKIFDMRQETAKLETDNARTRAQLAIDSFGFGLERRADVVGGKAGDFITQVRDYLQARGQGEADLQVKEKTARLQIAANERTLQQYILQVSDKVASIARTVEDYKRDQEKFRFESSRRIEDYRIKAEDYIYSRVKDRYEYAIGSEQEILRIKMEAANALGAVMPLDAGSVLAGKGPTAIGMAGLANPLGRQSSGLAPNWNQGLGSGRGHQGQDVGVDVGTTIHAIEDAVVEGVIRGFGKAGDAVILRYANSDKLGVYGHINPGVRQGDRVTAGQQIGVVTPDIRRDGSNNTHFHYELWKRSRGAGGQLLDPTERLRAAMSGRRVGPAMPAAASQKRSGPAMLLPGVTGPAMQPSVPATTDTMFDRRQSSARPGIGDQFVSMLGRESGYQNVASAQSLPVVPFGKPLPSYGPAPMAPPLPPAAPQLPAAPAPMVMPDAKPLVTELRKQKDELLQSVELASKLQKIEDGRLLLQLTSTREVRDRLDDAAKELALEAEIAQFGKSLSDNDQSRAIEKARTASTTRDLNDLEERSLGIAGELLQSGKLQKQEYDQITAGVKARIGYEKDLLQIAEDRAEVARREAYNQRAGELVRSAALTGAGLRAGLVGDPARAFEAEMAISNSTEQAMAQANRTRLLEDQQLTWGNLEKNIIDVSTAISGSLTNGLVDIVGGARQIEDVGRDMLNTIAGSFADSAQQQLTTLLQRQLGGLLGGAQGPLVKMLGAGGEMAGTQALGAASVVASGQVAAFGLALQTVTAQMALSGAMGGGSGLSGALGSLLSSGGSALGGGGNLFSKALSSNITDIAFGGFLAEGGMAQAGKGYVIGENEPEFFFPGVSGRVVPRSDMQKAEALRQGNAQAESIDIRYTVTEQQGQRFVTEEQFRKGMDRTSKRTQAMTYAGMRNNNEVRNFVGI